MTRLDCDVAALHGKLRFDHSLSDWNSWRVGGLSDCFYLPSDLEDFGFFLSRCVGDKPVTCIGLGSNLLVRDGGVRGIVVSLRDGFDRIERRGRAGSACARRRRRRRGVDDGGGQHRCAGADPGEGVETR